MNSNNRKKEQAMNKREDVKREDVKREDVERFETLVIEVTNPAIYDAVNPMNVGILGARVAAWSMGHRLRVHNLMYEKIEEYCDTVCETPDRCDVCPLSVAKQAWGAA
jgi:hypothetical protein